MHHVWWCVQKQNILYDELCHLRAVGASMQGVTVYSVLTFCFVFVCLAHIDTACFWGLHLTSFGNSMESSMVCILLNLLFHHLMARALPVHGALASVMTVAGS